MSLNLPNDAVGRSSSSKPRDLEREILYLKWQLDLERQFSRSLQDQLREEKEYSKKLDMKLKDTQESVGRFSAKHVEEVNKLEKKVSELEEEKSMFAEQLNYLLSRHRDTKVFTNPSEPLVNKIYDNAQGDYILFQLDIISAKDHDPLIIMEFLGKGTYGQVVKCLNMKTREFVAVKILKNKKEYYDQGLKEIMFLKKVNKAEDSENVVDLLDHFVFRGHLCLVFELLEDTLLHYQSLNFSVYQPNLNQIRDFMSQTLYGLKSLHKTGVIHTDLKPDNLMLRGNILKIIDLGSARDNETGSFVDPAHYITTRPYRAPEVVLGAGFGCSVDMWALGCVAAELFLGYPLFPSFSSWEHVRRLIAMFGGIPASLLRKSTLTNLYFDNYGVLKPPSGCAINTNAKASSWQEIVNMIMQAPLPVSNRAKFNEALMDRYKFVEFLGGCLQVDPAFRWTPEQALAHSFIANHGHQVKCSSMIAQQQHQQWLERYGAAPPLGSLSINV